MAALLIPVALLSKNQWGIVSVATGIIAYTIYLRDAAKEGGIEPHPFSWLLWGLVTGIAGSVQFFAGGGAGSWVTCFTAVVCFTIAGLAFLKREWHFKRSDRLALVFGVGVLLFYALTKEPTAAATLATLADVAGYGPTIEKAWREPCKDNALSFALNGFKFLFALPALESRSVATAFYPITLVVMNLGVTGLLILRRRQTAAENTLPEIAHVETQAPGLPPPL